MPDDYGLTGATDPVWDALDAQPSRLRDEAPSSYAYRDRPTPRYVPGSFAQRAPAVEPIVDDSPGDDLLATFAITRGSFRIPADLDHDSLEWARAYARGMPSYEAQALGRLDVTRYRSGPDDVYLWRIVRVLLSVK